MRLRRKLLFASIPPLAILASLGYVRWAKRQLANVNVSDGFETSALSNLWETTRFAPGAVTMQPEFVRAGHSATRIVLRSRDVFEPGIKSSKDTERAELLEASKLVSRENVTYEYAFSQFLPADFPIVPVRLVLAQWKQDCDGHEPCNDDSPVIALRYTAGVLQITRQNGPHREPLYESAEPLRGKWTDYRFQIRFTPTENGILKAWIDDRPVVDYHGRTAYPETPATGYSTPSRFYFKMGLYRDIMPDPMTIYIDEYRKRQLPE